MKKPNAHPARRIYRKIARIESGVRQKTFGSCDLIKERETGDAKCLPPSTLAPPVAGLLFVGPARHATGRRLRTLARHAHHPAAGRTSDRGQRAPARGVIGRVLINRHCSTLAAADDVYTVPF